MNYSLQHDDKGNIISISILDNNMRVTIQADTVQISAYSNHTIVVEPRTADSVVVKSVKRND